MKEESKNSNSLISLFETKKSFFSVWFVRAISLMRNYSKFNICSNFAIMITFKTDLLTSLMTSFVPFSNAFWWLSIRTEIPDESMY